MLEQSNPAAGGGGGGGIRRRRRWRAGWEVAGGAHGRAQAFGWSGSVCLQPPVAVEGGAEHNTQLVACAVGWRHALCWFGSRAGSGWGAQEAGTGSHRKGGGVVSEVVTGMSTLGPRAGRHVWQAGRQTWKAAHEVAVGGGRRARGAKVSRGVFDGGPAHEQGASDCDVWVHACRGGVGAEGCCACVCVCCWAGGKSHSRALRGCQGLWGGASARGGAASESQ